MIARRFMGLVVAVFMAVFMVLAGGVGQAWGAGEADALDAGVAAYRAEDYQTAIKHLLPLAITGNAEAQNRIAWMYFNGNGFPEDQCAAAIWAEKSARQGNPYAAIIMSYAYATGQGVREDREMAYRWMVYADKRGHPKAHKNLDFRASDLTPQARAEIDRDMETWDPAALPAPAFFVVDKSVLDKDLDLSTFLYFELGLSSCR